MREPTRDPLGLRAEAPLFDAFLRFAAATLHPFTIPGHKHRRDLLGPLVDGDIPLYAGLDTMKLSSGVLDQAEELAARAWGADVARFSVGGSTHGNQALALTVGRPGDRVVVGRTLHRSMLLGLVLADLVPTWVTPSVDPRTGLPLAVSADVVAGALADAPSAVAVLVTDPQYVGTYGDTGALAATAHRHGVPLVVDAAWAGHFGFHPDLPPHALAAGADALVISAHKALTALNQGAIVLARTERIDVKSKAPSASTSMVEPRWAEEAKPDIVRDTPQATERVLNVLRDLVGAAGNGRPGRAIELEGEVRGRIRHDPAGRGTHAHRFAVVGVEGPIEAQAIGELVVAGPTNSVEVHHAADTGASVGTGIDVASHRFE